MTCKTGWNETGLITEVSFGSFDEYLGTRVQKGPGADAEIKYVMNEDGYRVTRLVLN